MVKPILQYSNTPMLFPRYYSKSSAFMIDLGKFFGEGDISMLLTLFIGTITSLPSK